ncbi:hypothetical protein [Rubrivirga marina]|uniref:Uncharacterized protein n=1 Tax=Rubrivirga marina TaxID=1196024 RepID=A0A271J2X7_9BACT|nr:hypothetical protein [Rubrivirga marina]PAP77628.1 hypothetical protein BSZ37_14850 [Rubrivirga marina]
MRIALVLLVLAAAPAVAQPSATSVVEAWRTDWRRSAQGLAGIDVREEAEWTIDGPRGRTVVEADGRIRYSRGIPERDLDRVLVNGREVPADRGRGQGQRWQRAFGPAGREVHAPPLLPLALLGTAEPDRIEADREAGVAAWRVGFDSPAGRAEAWFTRSGAPHLLRVRTEGERPRGGRFMRDVRYARVRGLDLPVRAEATFTVRQRRRLRDYLVTLRADATYTGHTLR